ncbi:uncharacterized protein STEHIDRAFT_142755 [Stereum hirsutum FP-91666 SS1]|uniref:uncharacterized protein n=1 Tax=Stereum hirsutum (strain FP-91666) TaxID=721885 RepID=UPI0004449FDC|nr:uncharacterized protein STEHIDRAFT_142755 [Stereum hirsutum FP-91666 SS1]EIM80918.1 hypothetical protein STEHIDRAFT_142755 [Stereum hirsutum FP-91666 SS1]
MIKGLNVYCFICGGPTCKQFADCDGISLRGSNPAPWDELPGLTSSDASWLCDNTVAVYADCISPPGIYQRKENRLRPAAKIETVLGRMCFSGFAGDLDKYLRWGGEGERESYRELEEMLREMEFVDDGIHLDSGFTPNWARAMRPGDMTDYPVDIEQGVYIAHETCLFLATAWSKTQNPSHYGDSTITGEPEPDDVLKFGMCSDQRTHIASFFVYALPALIPNLVPTSLEPATAAFFAMTRANLSKIGVDPDLSFTRIDLQPVLRDFLHGVEPTKRSKAGGTWLEGRKSHNFYHREQYGIAHLKRPDTFPVVSQIQKPKPVRLSPWTVIGNPIAPKAFKLFPTSTKATRGHSLPLEIVLRILTIGDIDDSDVRSLERVSRSWKDFFRTPFMQKAWWRDVCCKVPFNGCLYLPTAADWTMSAEMVRIALKMKGKDAECYDWRGYFIRARKDLNIQNRRRILEAVMLLDNMIRSPASST